MKIRMLKILFRGLMPLVFWGCRTENIRPSEIWGTWRSNDSASFVFKDDNTFSGDELPARYFTFYTLESQVRNKRVNGSGTWEITKDQNNLQVDLHFKNLDDKNINGHYSVLISDSPRYLYVWKEEEGGERYIFKKK